MSLGEYEESNSEVAQRLNISEKDILSKSGIKKRFIAKNTSNLSQVILQSVNEKNFRASN